MRRHHSKVRRGKILICVQFKNFLFIVRFSSCVFFIKILICKKFSLRIFWSKFGRSYGAFAIEREETTGKIKNELMSNLDVFQHKKNIWHIKVNLIFPGSFPLSIAKAPYINFHIAIFGYNCKSTAEKKIFIF